MQHKREPQNELSTTNLANEMKLSLADTFQKLVEAGLIIRNGDNWELTKIGQSKGGIYKGGDNFRRYIVWPASIKAELEKNHEDEKSGLVTSTSIGKAFNISATRTNSILSELGWIKKDNIKGWHLTDLGKRLGGIEAKFIPSGVSFAKWPENIINNRILITNMHQASGDITQGNEDEQPAKISPDSTEFRDKFRAEHRAKDGHYVRSKSEIIIDNTLYDYKIVHAYERKLPIEENIYCDFYIPNKGGVYIEYWGLDDEKYLANKKRKVDIYNKYKFNLIELVEKDVSNLEDTLPAKLLEFGIPVE